MDYNSKYKLYSFTISTDNTQLAEPIPISSIINNRNEYIKHDTAIKFYDEITQVGSIKLIVNSLNTCIGERVNNVIDKPIYTPFYNTQSDPDWYRANTDLLNKSIVSPLKCIMVPKSYDIPLPRQPGRPPKRSRIISPPIIPITQRNKTKLNIIFSDNISHTIVSKNGPIPPNFENTFNQFLEYRKCKINCSKCLKITSKNDTFIDAEDNIICYRCASGYSFNDLYDWSDKESIDKNLGVCNRCHKRKGKPLNQFIKIDPKNVIIIQSTCRNCLLKKAVQNLKDKNQNKTLNNSYSTQNIYEKVQISPHKSYMDDDSDFIGSPKESSEMEIDSSTEQSSNDNIIYPGIPIIQRNEDNILNPHKMFKNGNDIKIPIIKNVHELSELNDCELIGISPYKFVCKDGYNRFIISTLGKLPKNMDDAIETYFENSRIEVKCNYCSKDVLKNNCFLDKDSQYLCLDCSYNIVNSVTQIYDWVTVDDSKISYILCHTCKNPKTLDQFIKEDKNGNIILYNDCRYCSLIENYNYEKNRI